MCETDCAPSTSTRAPWRCAICDHLARRSDGAERVRDLGERDEPRPRAEQLLVFVEDDWPRSSTGATRRRAPFSAHSICQGTMLAWCSSQVMTISSPFADVAAAPALGDEVDPLGGAADEDDFARGRGVEEARAPSRARAS